MSEAKPAVEMRRLLMKQSAINSRTQGKVWIQAQASVQVPLE